MPNVKLRTVINQDNSTTFQVQFEDGGEWVDLTWQMISDKPFESLNDLMFSVDEDGVLSITNIPTTCDWVNGVLNKPFISLNNNDFSVDANGVLSYSGSLSWLSITGKPFTTLDSDDFEINNGELSVKHQTIPNQSWSQITSKPFNSLDGDSFQVVGGVLYLNLNPSTPDWNSVQSKPFNSVDSSDFTTFGGVLKTIKQTWNTLAGKPFNSVDASDFSIVGGILKTIKQTWNTLGGKPFNTLNPDDFTLTDGELGVNFPTQVDPDWEDVGQKPFESLDETDFSTDADGKLSVNFPTPTVDWDSGVTNKPFSTLNPSDFSVDADGELSVTGGGGGASTWNDLTGKPFETLGDFFYKDASNRLRTNVFFSWSGEMTSGHGINTTNGLRTFLRDYLKNSLMIELLNVPPSLFPDGKAGPISQGITLSSFMIRVDNSILTQYSDTYQILMLSNYSRMWGDASADHFRVNIYGYGLPDYSDASNELIIEGWIDFQASKTGDTYTTVSYENSNLSSRNINVYSF